MSNENKKTTISHVLFSRRDKLESDDGEGYYPRIYANKEKRIDTCFLVSSLIFALITILIAIFFLPNFNNQENMRSFLETSAQTIGVILGLIGSIIFIVIQMNIAKFGYDIYTHLIRDKKIILYLLSSLFGLIVLLLGLAFISRAWIFEGQFGFFVINNSIIYLFSLILVICEISFLPYFIFRVVKRMSLANYLRFLYESVIYLINNEKDKVTLKIEIEKKLGLILQISDTAMKEKNREITQESIETLHDLLKFAINNQEKINSLLNVAFKQEGMFGDHYNWFEEELLAGLYSSFKISLETSQDNVARFSLKAIDSCLSESFNFELQEIIQEKIIKVYQKMVSLSIKNESLEEETISLLKNSFSKSFYLDKKEFLLFLNNLFNEEFVIQLLNKRPFWIERILSNYFHDVDRGSIFGKVSSENLVYFVRTIINILVISKKLIKLGEISSKKEAIFIRRLNDSLEDFAYLISLFISSMQDNPNSKFVKSSIKKEINLTSMHKKIKQVVTEQNDYTPRFNYLAHKLFTEWKNYSSTFNHKKLIKLSNDFNSLK